MKTNPILEKQIESLLENYPLSEIIDHLRMGILDINSRRGKHFYYLDVNLSKTIKNLNLITLKKNYL